MLGAAGGVAVLVHVHGLEAAPTFPALSTGVTVKLCEPTPTPVMETAMVTVPPEPLLLVTLQVTTTPSSVQVGAASPELGAGSISVTVKVAVV